MTKTTKIILISGFLASIVYGAISFRAARAQVIDNQPFTADIITTSVAGAGHGSFIPSMPNNTLPVSRVHHFAYNSQGDMAAVFNYPIGGQPLRTISYHDGRWVLIDAKTRTTVHLQTKHRDITFQNPPTLETGCYGPWDGQVSGYDVVYSEYKPQVPNSTEQVTVKMWSAPKLGCFTLKRERIDIHEGQLMYDITDLVTNIKVGDPDGSYFETESAANYTEVTHEHWGELAAPIFAQVTGQN